MTWVKLDDQFAFHPKVLAAGPEAAWLYVAGLCWCSQHLTDGAIPKAAVPTLAAVKRPSADRLVAAGLWVDHGDSFEVHDYLQFQPSKAKVEAEREAARKRQEKFRRARGGSNAVTDDVTSHSPTPDPSPDVGSTTDDDSPLPGAGSSSGSQNPHWPAIAEAGLIAARSKVPAPRNPDAFATKVAQNILREQAWAIPELLELRPELHDHRRLALVLANGGAPKAIEDAKVLASLGPDDFDGPDFTPADEIEVGS